VASVMSLLWVAKQLPPRLNNQQLPPVSARAKGCGGAAGAGPRPPWRGTDPPGAPGSIPA